MLVSKALTCFLFTSVLSSSLALGRNRNIARDQPARQKSTYANGQNNWNASKAVDGVLYDKDDEAAAHTMEEDGAVWWIVDLQKVYTISEVYIYGREKQEARSQNIGIYIATNGPYTDDGRPFPFDKDPWTKIGETSFKRVGVVTIPGRKKARYVAVTRENVLNLREVQVYEHPLKETNLAFNKPAYQSSTYDGWSASRAVDGNLNDNDLNGTGYAHTTGGREVEWWVVDLQGIFSVSEIYLYGRSGRASRNKNIQVYLGQNSKFTQDNAPTFNHGNMWEELKEFDEGFDRVGVVELDKGKKGRYVAVVRNRTGNGYIENSIINLKEVMIYQNKRANMTDKATDGITWSVANGYWEIVWETPIVFEHAYVVTTNGRSNELVYSYVYGKDSNQLTEIARVNNSDKHFVICRGFVTPVIDKFRIATKDKGDPGLTQVNIFKAEVQSDLEFLDLKHGHDFITISFKPFRNIPYIHNAYPFSSACLYQAYIREGKLNENKTFSSESQAINATSLSPSTEYTFELTCKIGDIEFPGPIGVTWASTLPCTTPAKPVVNLTQTERKTNNKSTVRLTVNIGETVPNCDVMDGYNTEVCQGSCLNSTLKTHGILDIEDLKPFENTTVIVIARNGAGKTSKFETTFTSNAAVPDEQPVLEAQYTTEKCISFKFKQPARYNGLKDDYKFRVSCTGTNGSPIYAKHDKIATICGLKSATKVDCNITAQNKVGDGPTIFHTNYTSVVFDAAGIMTKLDLTESKDFPTILVKLYPVGVANIPVSSYLVIAQQRSSTGLRKKRNVAAPCSLSDFEKLKNKTENFNNNSSDCYITAQFEPADIPQSGKEFYLGDGNGYGNYTNQPVTEGKEYMVQPVFIIKYKDNFTKLTQSSPAVIGKAVKKEAPITEPTNPDENHSNGTPPEHIAAPVVAAVIVAVIGMILVIILRRRQRNAENSKSAEQLELSGSATAAESPQGPQTQNLQPAAKRPVIPVKPLSVKGHDSDPYENNGSLRTDGIDPGLLASFIQNEANKIDEQFEDLDSLPLPNRSVALLPINDGKSRYKELYPGDDFRVKLSKNNKGTDYINASHIAGYKKNPGYIAAMGPTENTVNDFWLMIWEQNPSGMVMVTKTFELTRMKCYQYWPDEENTPMDFGDITVIVTNCEEWADYTVRTLQYTKEGETRYTKHFYFLSWPDHGVPHDTGGYIAFYNRIQMSISRHTTPLVVHCSAGVGRTGTFIAMDYLVKQAADENRLQFYECVEKMRVRRPRMIQTVAQYRFLYTAVCEFLSTKDFAYSPDRLASLLRDFDERQDTSSIQQEYELLQRRINSVQLQYSKAKLSANRDKNRFTDILAADGHRVFINRSARSDYINAVFFDAYKEKNRLIATQLPMKGTVEDFWTMVVEQGVKIIVQLENIDEEEPFFPTNGDKEELVFGEFTIARPHDKQTGEHADDITLQVSTRQAKHVVRVVDASKAWDGEAEPKASELINIHDQIEKLEQKSGSGTTIFTCLNGATRCGVMICMYNAIDKLKLEQQVDVYRPVLNARLRRPQIIANIAQYALIYEALKEYVEQYSDYGNFR